MQKPGIMDYRPKLVYVLALMCLALVFVALITKKRFDECHLPDLSIYYEYSLQLMQGHMPYRDFDLEYPPLALLAMILPRLLTFGQALSIHKYIGLFAIENLVFCILMGLLLLQVISHWQPKLRSLQLPMTAYVLLVVCCSPILLWRYDIFPALLTQMGLLSVLIGRPTRAGIWLGFGIAAKLYPVILLPIFSVYYLASREYLKLLGLLMGTVVATCLTMLPLALITGEHMLSFLRFHQLRGIQLESTAAGGIFLAQVLGLTKVSVVLNYGSYNLVSPLADSVVKWLPLIFILAFVGVIISCVKCFRFEYGMSGVISSQSLVAYIVATLLVFMAFGKVFSPQYIIWLLPFAPLLRRRQIGLMAAIFTTTMIIFPGFYHYLREMDTLFVLLLNLRNVTVILLVVWLLVESPPSSYKLAISRRYLF